MKRVSDLGNKHNNGLHQDQIFDNPSALCLALWGRNQHGVKGGGAVYPIGSVRMR